MKIKPAKKPGLIFIISGPSGSGKTTLAGSIVRTKEFKGRLVKSVSLTTRPRRSGEREGKDYFFVSAKQFQSLLKSEKILEWTRYLGYYYATPKDFVESQLKKGRHLVLCLDIKGARMLKRRYPHQTVTIFVKSPSLSTLRSRIEKRCHKTTPEEILSRMRRARRELRAVGEYDYQLLNENLKQVVNALKDLIKSRINA